MVQQSLVGQGLLNIELYDHTQGHTNTHTHSTRLLWTWDRPVGETCNWQHTTLTRDRYSCPLRNSNAQSQKASRPTPYIARPSGPATNINAKVKILGT